MVLLQEFDVKEWVKTRSSLDGEATFLTWNGYIAILAGVVNFLPHPSPPRTRGSGVRNSQMMRGSLYLLFCSQRTEKALVQTTWHECKQVYC